MKIWLILLLLPLIALPAFGEIRTTDKGTLDIDFSTSTEKIIPGEEIRMNIDFINPQTKKTQIHIDYFVTVLEDGTEIFGPTNKIHTSEGKASIPIKFQREGTYEVKIDVEGILFNAIPLETVSFPIQIGGQAAPACAEDEILENGTCVKDNGGCLIATAAFGSEMSKEVQILREIRDNSLLATSSGSAFMAGFNQIYYLFSPTVADWQRQNPVFNEAVKITIIPMISTLSILDHVNMDSEHEVLGYGIGMIVLNLAMYVGLPLAGIVKLSRLRKKYLYL